MKRIAALCLVLLCLSWGRAQARREQWIGADRCGKCHQAQQRAWQRGPHARSAKSLGERVGEGRCEACHGTGDAPAGRNLLLNVQCEACHGPGLHYGTDDIMRDPRLARALGLRELGSAKAREAVCMRCHRSSTSLIPFDVETSWSRIAH